MIFLMHGILHVVIVCVVLGRAKSTVDWCYGCATTTNEGACYKNTDELLAERSNVNESIPDGTTWRQYVRKCSYPYNVGCATLYYEQQGQLKIYMRECTDGTTFPFKDTQEANYDRLRTAPWDNQTACTYNGAYLVCMSKCNSSVFCNGPQIHSVSGASTVLMYHTLTIGFLCVVFYCILKYFTS